jgi:RNA recognition motif-containing protein
LLNISLTTEAITNKKLRHRMEKAAYQLDPTAPPIKKPTKPATKAEKKATAAAAASAAKTLAKTTTKTVPDPSATAATAAAVAVSVFSPENPIDFSNVTVDKILTTLAASTTANELLVAVENIPARKEDLLVCFQKSCGAGDGEGEGDGDKDSDEDSAKEFNYDGAQKLLTIFETILEEDGYVNAKSTTVVDISAGDGESTVPVKIKLIAKTKRKIKRITVALAAALSESAPAPPPSAVVVESESESVPRTESSSAERSAETVISGRGTEGGAPPVAAEELPPLEPIIESLRKCTNPMDIEALLNDVKPGAGSCKSRRTLKRTLDRLLQNEEENSEAEKRMKLTSNSRRKVKRVLKIIEPNANDGTATPAAAKATPQPKEEDSKKRKAVGEAGETDENGVIKKAKFRLFIGQMDFDTTAAELESYLREQGLDCPINIRILTDRETGKSRGAAFLDICGGKRSLKRCLSLHHTLLKGRRINVEKTSKDVKDEMAIKQRRIDLKIQESEKIDRILQEYEDNTEKNKGGVFKVKNISDSMMNRLYAMNTNEIQGILTEFSASSSSQGRHVDGGDVVFNRLVTAKDGGGSAVDQSKNRGYGGFTGGGGKGAGGRGGGHHGDSSHGRGSGSGSHSNDKDTSGAGAGAGAGASGSNDDVPWGYSGVPPAGAAAGEGGGGRGGSSSSSGLSEVFQSMRGRGGKRVGSSR